MPRKEIVLIKALNVREGKKERDKLRRGKEKKEVLVRKEHRKETMGLRKGKWGGSELRRLRSKKLL